MAYTFPNESPAYRAARAALLDAEVALRAQIEAVAAQRRALPPGGAVPQDYVFTEMVDGAPQPTPLSALFGPDHDTLILYNFMYGPQMDAPCTSCASIADGFVGTARHVEQRARLVMVAASPIARITALTQARGWQSLRWVSSAGVDFNRDYHGETASGSQMPMAHVFERTADGVRHRWSSEMLGRTWAGGDQRHVDLLWPLWHLLDLTPAGRGDFYPALEYGAPEAGCCG